MQSFFRRMSSIVRKSSNKSSCDTDEVENEDNNEERQRKFRQMQQRRRSAPDIHRRAAPADRLVSESNKKVTSFEQINSQNLGIHCYTTGLTRKNFHSSGKLIEYRVVLVFF